MLTRAPRVTLVTGALLSRFSHSCSPLRRMLACHPHGRAEAMAAMAAGASWPYR